MVYLFHIAAIVKTTSIADYKTFREACINVFNKRYLVKIIVLFNNIFLNIN